MGRICLSSNLVHFDEAQLANIQLEGVHNGRSLSSGLFFFSDFWQKHLPSRVFLLCYFLIFFAFVSTFHLTCLARIFLYFSPLIQYNSTRSPASCCGRSKGGSSRTSKLKNRPDTVLGRPSDRSTEDQVLTVVDPNRPAKYKGLQNC